MREDNQEITFSFSSSAFQESPSNTMAKMREKCPLHKTVEPENHYTLTREIDVVQALRNEKLWSSSYGPGLAFAKPGTGVLVSSDPPKHTRERLAISRIFRPSVIQALESDIEILVNSIIDSKKSLGEGDIIKDFAAPIPLTVMCWLLGTPINDIDLFRSWVLPMAEAVTYVEGREASEDVISAYKNFNSYFGSHIQTRSDAIEKGDSYPDDLLTRLLTVENDGSKLSKADVLGFCQFLLVAGSETTTLMIGNIIYRLMEHPDQFKLLKEDSSLVENTVEESLRYDAPVHGLFRTNTKAITMHGETLPKDSKVCMMFSSANRDPSAWHNPEVFDITRDIKILRNHASFGVGSHYCLGAPLSRLEGTVFLKAVLDRLPLIRSNGEPTLTKAGILKGFASLPVRWD